MARFSGNCHYITIKLRRRGGGGKKTIAVTDVKLDQPQLYLALDPATHKTAQLKATVLPAKATNKTVKWELKDASEDGVISIVKNGNTLNITAEKPGTVTVVAKDSGLGSRSAECLVTVVAEWKAVNGVSLDSPTLEVNEGKKKSLTATVSPGDATDNLVKWEITEGLSNITIEDYATLSGSFTNNHTISVAGRTEGTAKIKVTTQDGDFSEICSVTINPPVPVPYKLVVRNLRAVDLNIATTPDSDSIVNWLGSTWADSPLTITNAEGAHAGNDRPPANTTVAYVYPPIRGSFTWEIKATITGGTTGGLMVSRFLNAADYAPVGGQGTRLPDIVGISHMGSPAVRTVFPRNDGTTMNSTNPGGTVATLPIGTEYIYRVTWNAALKTTKLEIVSDTTTLLTTDIGPSTSWSVDSVQSFLSDSNPIQNSDAAFYPAFWVSSNSVTITSMKVLVESDEIDTTSISIRDKQNTQLGINNTRKLAVDFTPQDATFQGVTWESSAPLIATVGKHSGVVTGIADGSATITATPAISGSPDSFTITVAKIPVQSVSIQTAAGATTAGQQFAHGEPLQLRAIITPENASDQTVTWASSNPTIASIDETSGLVSLNADGTANITATADGVTSSDFVIVVDKAVVTGITIDQKTGATPLTLYEDEAAIELTATVKPDALGHEDKAVKWSSSNAAMATVGEDTGIVTYVAPGNVTITATSVGKNALDQSVTDTVVINLTAGGAPGLKMIVRNMAPTPAAGTTPDSAAGKIFITLTETTPGKVWTFSGNKVVKNADNGSYGNGIQNGTLVYLSTEVTGKFTWSGKIKLNTGSTSGNYGVSFGMFLDMPVSLPTLATVEAPLCFAGPRLVYSGVPRWLWTNNLTTSGNNTRADSSGVPANLLVDTVYDYEIKWDGTEYTLKLDTTSFRLYTGSSSVFQGLFGVGRRQPGIIVQGPTAGSSITITELKLTNDND